MTRGRLVAALAALLAVFGVVIGVLTSASAANDEIAVDVIFDDARGLIPGQQVMVAGAAVGSIEDVSVTRDYKARIHMRVDARFAPFRADATCTIKPQGLIAENYVECSPGTSRAEPLRATGGHSPTVPVEHTTQPVSLTDLFEVWNTPTRQRVAVLLSTLGLATAARGEDLNGILRRANPALALARRTIRQLDSQRDDLARFIDASQPVAAALARRPERLTSLVRRAGRVMTQTASERGALAEGVRRLPGLLGAARPALAKLDAVMTTGTPLLDELTAAAPAMNRVSGDVPRLARAARPALRALGPVLRSGAATAKSTAPLSRVLARYARESLPSALTAGRMLPTLEERGLVRDLLAFLYNTALATARYDDQSHLLPSHVALSNCSRYATTPDPGCGAPSGGPASRRARSQNRAEMRAAPATGGGNGSSPHPGGGRDSTPQAPGPGAPATPEPSPRSTPPPVPGQEPSPVPPSVEEALDYLLG